MIQLPQEFNVADYLVDRNIRERRGEKIAIECGDLRVSYRELLERTNRAGNFLRQLGVRRGERVALLLMDTPEFFYCYFGAIKIGAVAVPVNPFQKAKDCFYVLKDSGARVVVVESVWPNAEFVGGMGINALVSDDPAPPLGGAVFHDTAVWVRAEAAVMPIAAE